MEYYSLQVRDKEIYLHAFRTSHSETLSSDKPVHMADVIERIYRKGILYEQMEKEGKV